MWLFVTKLIYAVCFGYVFTAGYDHKDGTPNVSQLASMKFLITVNDTWDTQGCIDTVSTPLLQPGVKYNKTDEIRVGPCDHGPLRFNITQGEKSLRVDLVFFSSVIEDASPPTCSIPWDAEYLMPTKKDVSNSLLPGCFVMDSREGYHMTYYWFHILFWTFQ